MLAYLRRLARRVAADRGAMGMLASNAVALAIAVFNPPVTMAVMFLFWAECAIVGLLNFAKLYYISFSEYSKAELEQMGFWKKVAFKNIGPGIFLVHFGGFVFILFVMLQALARHEMLGRGQLEYDVLGHLAGFWPALLVISFMHVMSFFRNYLGKREYEGRTYEDQMTRPYGRVFLMVFIMWTGYLIVALTGLPEMALLAFVPFKIIADLEAHFRERAAYTSDKGEGK